MKLIRTVFSFSSLVAIALATSAPMLAQSAGSLTAMQRYAQHDSAAAAARKAGDWATYKSHIVVLDSLLHGHPNVRVVMARIDSHLGDTADAYANLRDFAKMGLTRRIDADTSLRLLQGTPEWNAIIAEISGNGAAVGKAEKAFALPDSEFIAEDVTYDAAGRRFFITSVRHGEVISATPSGLVTRFASVAEPGWGMFATAADPARKTLWVTAETIPQAVGFNAAIKGKAAVLRYDLPSGKLLQRYDLPSSEDHEAGDIAVAENGDLFVSDGHSGALYVIRKGGPLALLVAPGEFASPQGPAVPPGGRFLYVADYVRGLARVDRQSGAVSWMNHPRNVALNGIDGLAWVDAHTLVGVQNGVAPNRLLEISLSDDGSSVIAAKVLMQSADLLHDPTHSVVVGRDLYFIANGGFGAFGDDGKPVTGEKIVAPVIMKIVRVR